MNHPFDWRVHRDVISGLKQGCLIGLAIAVMTIQPTGSARLATPTLAPPAPAAAAHRAVDWRGSGATDDARTIAEWVADSRDNGSLPFAILDKRDARVYVFDSEARLIAASPVLLGAAPGDDSVAGIGQRPISQVRPEERTTPAGRFISAPGRNASGENVVWVDYDNAVSMHRVRPVDPKERRLERLASPDPAQRRISYGCINVPVAFFDSVVQPVLASGRAVVYVLPETRPLQQTFAAYAVSETRISAANSR